MDTSISHRKADRLGAAAECGIRPAHGCCSKDLPAWAHAALEAYSRRAPKALLQVPHLTERVRLGVFAAEALIQSACGAPDGQVVGDQESVHRAIGDLVAQVFCLTGDQVTAQELHQSAEGFAARHTP